MKWIAFFLFSATLFGQNCVPALALNPNDSQSGEITSTSCQLADSSRVAAYRLTVPVRGTVQLTPKGTGFTPSVILRNSDGKRVDSGATISHYLEPGVYTALINTASVGKFTLTSVFAPEANVLCAIFPRLGASQNISGSLSAASCKLPDGTSYDAWQMTVYGAGTLTVTMSSSIVDSYLILRSEAGYLLASDDNSGGGKDATFSIPVSGRETYTLIAAGATTSSKLGAYQVTTDFAPSDEETCRPLRMLTDSVQVNGSISTASCNFDLPERQDSSLFNVYSIHLTTAGVVQLSVPNSTFAPLLLLLDRNGNYVVEDSESGGAYTPSLRQALLPGDYSVVIFNEDSFEGEYGLQYTFTPGPVTPCAAQQPIADQPLSGTLNGDTSCRMSELLTDIYPLVLPSSSSIGLDLSSSDFSTFLELHDSKNNLLSFGDESAQGSSAHIQATLAAGSYYVLAASSDLPGTYNFAAQVTPKSIPACSKVQTLAVNTGYLATLANSACSGQIGEQVDYYRFTTTADGTLAIVMSSLDMDSNVTLTDSSGKEIRWDDNSYGYGDAIVVHLLKAGTYKIEARGRQVEGSGLYRIDLLWTAGAKPAFCSATSLKLGALKTGSLTYTGCQYYDNTFADVYQFQVIDSNKPITISANSDKLDPFLVLTDAKGNLLMSDDNSGGGTSASLTALLDAGTYYVAIKPSDDPSNTGIYQILISQ